MDGHELFQSLPYIIGAAIPVLLLILIVRASIKASKTRKLKSQKTLQEKSATMSVGLTHTTGLPIAEGTACTVYSCSDKYEFIGGNTKFELQFSKVADICLKTDTEIQQQYVSSVGGAVGGAVLFGPLGAMIGGRAKKKKSKTITTYLIFTYKKEDTVEYLAFEVSSNLIMVRKLVYEFEQHHRQEADSVVL